MSAERDSQRPSRVQADRGFGRMLERARAGGSDAVAQTSAYLAHLAVSRPCRCPGTVWFAVVSFVLVTLLWLLAQVAILDSSRPPGVRTSVGPQAAAIRPESALEIEVAGVGAEVEAARLYRRPAGSRGAEPPVATLLVQASEGRWRLPGTRGVLLRSCPMVSTGCSSAPASCD